MRGKEHYLNTMGGRDQIWTEGKTPTYQKREGNCHGKEEGETVPRKYSLTGSQARCEQSNNIRGGCL